MDTTVAQLYRIEPETVLERIRETISAALSDTAPGTVIPTFFRADDIGVISENFFAMTDLFERHRLPLGLAVVPSWLTRPRWEAIGQHLDPSLPLWCWHQHGWNHRNHESTGKKYEFGPSRSDVSIKTDLTRGKKRLESIITSDFAPLFTPPWNRCSDRTIELLSQLGFHAISRSSGEQKNPAVLPDFFINVDLHTRKEAEPAASLDGLCRECTRGIRDAYLGIMLHHQRMDRNAIAVLDGLLTIIGSEPRLQPIGFKQTLRRNN